MKKTLSFTITTLFFAIILCANTFAAVAEGEGVNILKVAKEKTTEINKAKENPNLKNDQLVQEPKVETKTEEIKVEEEIEVVKTTKETTALEKKEEVPEKITDIGNKDLKKTIKEQSNKKSSLNIIQQVEQNLMYNKEIKKQQPGEAIIIKKGGWKAEELDEETDEESEMQAEISTSEIDERNMTLNRKAYDAVQLNQTEIAVEFYKQILEQDKTNSHAMLGLATSYHQLGQYRQAKPLYMKLLETYPGDEQIIANLLAIVTEETPYESVYLLESLAEKNPNSPLIQAQTSIAYSNIKKYDQATKYLKKALILDSTNMHYRYNLAVLYDLQEKYSQASRIYKSVLSYASENDLINQIPYKEIRKRIEYIEELKV